MTDDDFQRDYLAATDGAGLSALEGWSAIRVTGADRAAFLHNMCTNDVKGLAAGAGCEAFFTDVRGKIVAHAFILAGAENIQLVLPAAQAEPLLSHLDRYIIREDVQLDDESVSMSWSLAGRQAGVVLGQFAAGRVAGLSAPWSHATISINSANVTVVRFNLPWCGGYLIGIAISDLNGVHAALVERGASVIPVYVWHAIRVESAWPMWGVDFDGANLAQEAGRNESAIHFRKGCYLGQETVARVDALGHVNKKLVQVQFDGSYEPEVGAELSVAGQSVGRVSSATWSPRRQAPLALAMVKRGANELGAVMTCGDQSGVVTSGEANA